MSIMDFYNEHNAEEALEQVLAAKAEFLKEIETLDAMAFLLKCYLATGEMMDPAIFGIPDPEEDEDEDE